MRGFPECAIQRNHQFARDNSNAKTRRNSLSLAEIHNGPQVKQSPYAGFVRRWSTTQLHAPPTFGACRIAVFLISRANEHHEHEGRPNCAASQEAPRSDERTPASTTQFLRKGTHWTTSASYLKCSKSAKATHGDQDHVTPCRFEKKFARTLTNVRPYLFSDVPCRNRKDVRPFNNSRKKRSPETWAAPVRRTEGSTKRVRCGLHTARRPESAQLPKRDEMAASRKYCRAALISEMRETRTAQHVCVRKIRTNGQTARLLT